MPLRLEPVRDRKLYRLAKGAPVRRVRKGNVIYRGGELGGCVFLVQEGHVCLRVGLAGEGRGERTVAVAGPSELFGEEGMVPGALRPYTAIAGETVVVVSLDGSDVRGVLRSSQHTLTTYLEVKERDLQLLRASATGSPGPSARERLAGVILDLAARLGQPEGESVRLPHWFTHHELADLAGAHRSTVTTALNDWIWRGVIETSGRALVLDAAGLAALAAVRAGTQESVDRNPRQD